VVIVGATPTPVLRARRDECEDWVHLLNEAANRLPSHGELTVRSSILPMALAEDLATTSPTYRALAIQSYCVSTSLIVASPPGQLRRQRIAVARTLSGLFNVQGIDRLSLSRPIRPEDLLDDSCGFASRSFSGPGARMSESVDLLVADEFAASVYVVDGWPGRSIDPQMLLPLFAPGPPSRVVSLVLGPLEVRRAQRQVARHRTEMVADRKLRRDRGYLDRARDDYREATALSQEDELLAGFRLCRYRVLVVLLAPNPQSMVTSRTALEEIAAAAQLRVVIAFGEQRRLFEQALAGVPGWS
jgi:hypothetical protein